MTTSTATLSGMYDVLALEAGTTFTFNRVQMTTMSWGVFALSDGYILTAEYTHRGRRWGLIAPCGCRVLGNVRVFTSIIKMYRDDLAFYMSTHPTYCTALKTEA